MPQIWPKRCACGRTYTPAMWRELPRPRPHVLPWGEEQEYRDCVCGSTIVIVTKDEPTPEVTDD